MGKANKALLEYVKGCLNRGYSFLKIEKDLVNRGYTRRVAEGIILKYKYRGDVFKWLTVVSLSSLFVLSLFLGGSGIIGMATVSYKASYENTLHSTVVAVMEAGYTFEFSWDLGGAGTANNVFHIGFAIGPSNGQSRAAFTIDGSTNKIQALTRTGGLILVDVKLAAPRTGTEQNSLCGAMSLRKFSHG